MAKFAGLDAQVLGISVDHVPCLKAWAGSLGGISYPLMSDFWPHGNVAEQYGVLRSEGYSERAIFILDKAGIVQYIDIHDIDEQPDNLDLMDALVRIDPTVAANLPEPVDPANLPPLPHGGVIMYCTAWCPDCKRARAWLQERNLPYTEVDINRTPGASDQLRIWADNMLTTPTFEIDGTVILNFDEERLSQILER